MLIIQEVKVDIKHDLESIVYGIAKHLKVNSKEILDYKVIRKSLDARKKPYYNYSVVFNINNENKYLRIKNVSRYHEFSYPYKQVNTNSKCIVIGFGPSGMLAAYMLAKSGINVTVLERGQDVDQRSIDIKDFWEKGILNTESNVQFGEGGAGTFSDGKLTTRIKDKRIQTILDILITMGADPSIKYEAHPHIGTDVLKDVVKNFRKAIISYGGSIKFNHLVSDFIIEDNRIIGVAANNEIFNADNFILAIGHSAKDTLITLDTHQVAMEAKDFAIGVRVEHPQLLINKNQHKDAYKDLGASEYRLTYHASDKYGVYSFCMCPGGYVVASSSDANTLCTNGMSYSKRDGKYANSAILVQVKKEDYYKGSLFDGLSYQRNLEEKAYNYSGSYNALAMNIKDFMTNTLNPLLFESTYKPGTKTFDLHLLFDSFIIKALKEAFIDFDNKIPGFIEQGIMIAPETRSSAMARIIRDTNYKSTSHPNLYPIGEGAGHAGGIMSSALDGFKVAEIIIDYFT